MYQWAVHCYSTERGGGDILDYFEIDENAAREDVAFKRSRPHLYQQVTLMKRPIPPWRPA